MAKEVASHAVQGRPVAHRVVTAAAVDVDVDEARGDEPIPGRIRR